MFDSCRDTLTNVSYLFYGCKALTGPIPIGEYDTTQGIVRYNVVYRDNGGNLPSGALQVVKTPSNNNQVPYSLVITVSSDLLGLDMIRKIAILTMLGTNKIVDLNQISHMGIENITDKFMSFVNNKSCVIKFISEVIKLRDGKYHMAVLPVIVSKESIMAQTHNENNTIFLDCVDNGRLVFNGLGAGKYPTASSILSDILDVYDNRNYIDYNADKYIEIDNDQLLRNYYVIDNNNIIKYIESARLSELKEYKFYALDKRTSTI